MNAKSFKHIELKLHEPVFGGKLTSLVVDLEHLRRLRLGGSTHPALFFELKKLFHYLESIGSARIEGNNTTISQFIETQLEDRPFVNEQIEEIRNIEKAMRWVDEMAPDNSINRGFVSELHKMIVTNLTPPPDGEGDHTPGDYRNIQVEIKGSDHLPAPPFLVNELMESLFDFIKEDLPSQFDLIRIAMAHHRFMWIHPFANGNGRTGRLLTYAMLVKTGFRVNVGQILNPTAVFCIDREKYNSCLALADQGTFESNEAWCTYVLEGLHTEIQKIERLSHDEYVQKQLLLPALEYSHKMKYIDKDEFTILKIAAQKKVMKASDLKPSFKNVHTVTISRKIKGLRDKKMLQPESEGANKYHLSFINNFLIRGMIQALEKEGYIPLKD